LFGIAESGLLLSDFSVANRTAPRRRAMWFTLRPMFRAAVVWMNGTRSRYWEMTTLMSDREVAAATAPVALRE
jgi:hypothetical protein